MEVVTGPDGTVQVTFCSSDMWLVTEEDRDGWCKITPEEDDYAFWAYLRRGVQLQDRRPSSTGTSSATSDVSRSSCSSSGTSAATAGTTPTFGDEPIEGWYMELYVPDGRADRVRLHRRVRLHQLDRLRGRDVHRGGGGPAGLVPHNASQRVPRDRCPVRRQGRSSRGVRQLPRCRSPDIQVRGRELERRLRRRRRAPRAAGTSSWSGTTAPSTPATPTSTASWCCWSTGPACTPSPRTVQRRLDPDQPGQRHGLVNVVSGTEVPVQMFGNFHDVTITVFKFEDMDGDGRYDAEDQRPRWRTGSSSSRAHGPAQARSS